MKSDHFNNCQIENGPQETSNKRKPWNP